MLIFNVFSAHAQSLWPHVDLPHLHDIVRELTMMYSCDTYRGMTTLRIKALCNYSCLADWNIEANSLTYYRVPEELP